MSDVFSSVTFEYLNTHVVQAIGDGGAFQVRAGDAKAEVDEHLGNTGHADATDAYEMDVLDSSKHYFPGLTGFFQDLHANHEESRKSCPLRLSSSIMSTAAAAASPCASLRLASSIRLNSSGAFTSLSISAINRS